MEADKLQVRERHSSRALIVNQYHEIFLFQYSFDYFMEENVVWITPGGGLEEGETYEDALVREVREELGLHLSGTYACRYYRDPVYRLKSGIDAVAHERFFVIRIEKQQWDYSRWSKSEKAHMKAGRWWSKEEIEASKEEFFSADIRKIMENIKAAGEPGEPERIA